MKILDVPQSGSVAGTTSSRNRFGQYRRTRAIPVNPNSQAQTDTRGAFSAASALWRTISQANRDSWNYAALSQPRVDALGQSITLSGFQLFVGTNSLLTIVGASIRSDAPTGTFLATPTIDIDDDSIAGPIALLFTVSPVPADTAYVIFSSPPLSPGITFNRDYRYLTQFNAADVTPTAIGTALATKWGATLVGQKYLLKVKAVITNGASRGISSPYSSDAVLITTA